MDNSRVFKMSFASVYPHYIQKAEKIRQSWEPDLSNYKKMRQKYLLYK
jgi:hypothetical protein